MKVLPVDLNKDYEAVIAEACRTLRAGGTVIYPTDTVYGLGANACDSMAVEKVFQIKQRPRSKPLPVLVRNLEWAKQLAYINKKQEKILQAIWPVYPVRGNRSNGGPVTVILPKREHVSPLVVANGVTIGLRVADFPLVDRLLGKFGYPLTATSTNLVGQAQARDSNKILATFAELSKKPNLFIYAGILPVTEPSTVLDLTGEEPKILRVGPANPGKLLKLLQEVV